LQQSELHLYYHQSGGYPNSVQCTYKSLQGFWWLLAYYYWMGPLHFLTALLALLSFRSHCFLGVFFFSSPDYIHANNRDREILFIPFFFFFFLGIIFFFFFLGIIFFFLLTSIVLFHFQYNN
jgi:hypothetical protein